MVLERCSTYTCYIHFACASFFGIFTSVLVIDIRHVHMVSIKSMHSQFIIYTTYYKTRFMHKYLVALIWCSKLYTTKWLKKYAQSFPAWGKVVQIAQTCYTRRIAVLLEPPFRLCQNSAVPTGRDLVTFNRTERQRYAAILEIAKVSTQNPCRAMQSYAELCRVRWSRLVICQGQTEQGCRGTVVHGHGLQWASGQAVKRWLCASCGSCGSCIFVLHILLWQTINIHQRNASCKQELFEVQEVRVPALPRFSETPECLFSLWEGQYGNRSHRIDTIPFSCRVCRSPDISRHIQMFSVDFPVSLRDLGLLGSIFDHFGNLFFSAIWNILEPLPFVLGQMIFMKSNLATIIL